MSISITSVKTNTIRIRLRIRTQIWKQIRYQWYPSVSDLFSSLEANDREIASFPLHLQWLIVHTIRSDIQVLVQCCGLLRYQVTDLEMEEEKMKPVPNSCSYFVFFCVRTLRFMLGWLYPTQVEWCKRLERFSLSLGKSFKVSS